LYLPFIAPCSDKASVLSFCGTSKGNERHQRQALPLTPFIP
jgi:hypothetical protein